MQAVARHMIAHGTKGRIINMASQAGRRGEPLVAVYCASKAAIISLTQSAGLNLIAHGINVNAIAPGVVDGEHWDGVDEFFANTKVNPRDRRNEKWPLPFPMAAWAGLKTLRGWRCFSPRTRQNTSLHKPTMSMVEIG